MRLSWQLPMEPGCPVEAGQTGHLLLRAMRSVINLSGHLASPFPLVLFTGPVEPSSRLDSWEGCFCQETRRAPHMPAGVGGMPQQWKRTRKSHHGSKNFTVISLEPAGCLDSAELGKATVRAQPERQPQPQDHGFCTGLPSCVSLTLFWPQHSSPLLTIASHLRCAESCNTEMPHRALCTRANCVQNQFSGLWVPR